MARRQLTRDELQERYRHEEFEASRKKDQRALGSEPHPSPLSDTLIGKFTEGERAIVTVILDTIKRAGGPCALCRAAIAKQAGTGASTYARALRKAHDLGLLATELHGKNRLIRLAEPTTPRPTPNP